MFRACNRLALQCQHRFPRVQTQYWPSRRRDRLVRQLFVARESIRRGPSDPRSSIRGLSVSSARAPSAALGSVRLGRFTRAELFFELLNQLLCALAQLSWHYDLDHDVQIAAT
jgi:hypothetical protein